tara:strand:+ start:255 stop:428 length:174 start_codon:yes stop_codon:yes gene_type:complete
MKSINFSPKISNQITSNNELTNKLEKGITNTLLEKYKTKDLYNIETLREKKALRRVA